MLTLDCFSIKRPASIFLGTLFSEEVLTIFEKRCPEDSSPRNSIKAAKLWLEVRTKEDPSTDDIYAAVYVSANLVNASSAYHVSIAAGAIDIETSMDFYIHSILLKHLDKIIQFHLDEKINLRNPEQVFQWLSEEKKEDFIYNLNIFL